MFVRVADRLRVLGQVVRLRLLEQLRSGEATPQELADMLGLTQQNVSKHPQVLFWGSGMSARWTNVFYRLADDSIARVLDDVVARGARALA
jgi:hypothetical protein